MVQTSGLRLTRGRIADGIETAVSSGRDLVIWCVEPRGFGCRIRPSGAASYIYQYRVRGGRNGPLRKLTIGKTTTFTPEEARVVARQYAQAVALGRDPQREKMAARRQPTVAELFEQYLAEEGARLSPRTIANIRSHLKNQLKPLAGLRIDDLRKADVAAVHGALHATPYAANRAMATLSSVFSFAERRDLLPTGTNPVKGLRRFTERHRERMLDAEEVAALWAALIDLQEIERHRFAAPAIMLGMLTGWRVGEVRTLAWANVDLVAYEAVITGKTGARRAPFPKSTHRLLHYLAEVTPAYGRGQHRGAHVFPSTAGRTRDIAPLTDWEHQRSWRKAIEIAGVEDVRRHDLRHLIAGVIGMQTGSAIRVKEALGHRSLAMSERYVAPISALQRRSTDQAAALVLAFAEREEAALDTAFTDISDLPAPERPALPAPAARER